MICNEESEIVSTRDCRRVQVMESNELWRGEGSKGSVQVVPNFYAPRSIGVEEGEIGFETWPITRGPMPGICPMSRLIDYTNVIVVIPNVRLNKMSVVLDRNHSQ